MKIKEYQVIAPAGVVWNESIVVQGGTIAAPTADGRIKAYLHFRQVRENATVAEIPAPRASEAATAAPLVGALNPEPGHSTALVDSTAELSVIGTVAATVGGGEFVGVPAEAMATQAAAEAAPELGEAAAQARAKRKSAR